MSSFAIYNQKTQTLFYNYVQASDALKTSIHCCT